MRINLMIFLHYLRTLTKFNKPLQTYIKLLLPPCISTLLSIHYNPRIKAVNMLFKKHRIID